MLKMDCNKRIFKNEDGSISKVLDSTGDPSILYNEILHLPQVHGDSNLALKLWAKAIILNQNTNYFDSKFSPSQISDKLTPLFRESRDRLNYDFDALEKEFINNPNIIFTRVTGDSGLIHYKDETNPTFRSLNGSFDKAKDSLFSDRNNVEITSSEPTLESVYSKLFTSNVTQDVYNQLDVKDIASYAAQITENTTGVQKQKVEELLSDSKRLTLSDDGGNYVLDGVKQLERTSTVIEQMEGPRGQKDYYKFEGDSTQFENNRQWGNLLDDVLSGVITGESKEKIFEDISNKDYNGVEITQEAFLEAVGVFQDLMSKNSDNIVLTQVGLFNSSRAIAGTADILVVQPNGSVKIIDLKSSIKSTEDSSYTNKFKDSKGNPRASKKEKHIMQQSLYAAMLTSKAYTIDSKPISILPLHLTQISNNRVDTLVGEDIFGLTMNEELYDSYKKDSDTQTTQPNELVESKYSRMVNLLKEAQLKKLAELKKRGKITETSYIERLKDTLNISDHVRAISTFVEKAHNQILGDTKSGWPGYETLLSSKIQRINNSKDIDAIKELTELQNYYSMMSDMLPVNNPVIADLIAMYKNTDPNSEVTPGSPLYQIKQIVDAVAQIESNYLDTIHKLQAEIFESTLSDQRLVDIKKELNRLNERRKLAESTSNPKRAKRIMDKIIAQGGSIDFEGNIVFETDLKKSLYKQFKDGSYNNISAAEVWVTSISQSGNSIIAGYTKMFKKAIEKARVKMIKFADEAAPIYEALLKEVGQRSNYTKINDGLFKIVSYENNSGEKQSKKVFISPINYDGYHKAFKNYITSLKIDPTDTTIEATEARRKWYKDNKQPRPEKSITLDGNVLIEGAASIKARKKEELSNADYKAWEFKNTNEQGDYIGELSIPNMDKYYDPLFNSLYGAKSNIYKSKTAKQKAYSFMISKYFKAQSRVGVRSEEHKFTVPSIFKTKDERLLEAGGISGAIENVKFAAKDAILKMQEDSDIFGDPATNSVYMKYEQNMNANDVSNDLMGSIIKYENAANEYIARESLLSLGEAIKFNFQKTDNPFAISFLGKRILKSNHKEFTGDAKFERAKNNNVEQAFTNFFETQILGRTKVDGGEVLGVDGHKAAGTINGYASLIQMGPVKLTNLANALQGNVNLAMEAVAKEYFTGKNWRKAMGKYLQYEGQGDFIADRYKNNRPQSTITKLIELYDPMRVYNESTASKITDTVGKKALTGLWFKAQEKGEHQVAVAAMIAILDNKIINYKGKQMSMLEVYEQYGVDAIEVDYDVMSKLHSVNKRLHGAYAKIDKTELERHWWGSLVAMYRKFLIPGIQKRWKGYSFDEELGQSTSGAYRDFLNILRDERDQLSIYLNPMNKEASNLSDLQKANVKRSLYEFGVIVGLGIVVMALQKAGDDDEELKKKRSYNYALYFGLRLLSETKTFGMVGDPTSAFLPGFSAMTKTANTVSFSESGINKIYQVLKQVASDPTEKYKRDSGAWDKGDSKLGARLLKMVGYTGQTFRAPEEARKLAERFYD